VEKSNKSFQPTKPFVTALAGARPAPNAFAAEADVILTSGRGSRIEDFIAGNCCPCVPVVPSRSGAN